MVLGSSMEQSITTIPHRRKSFPCMIMKLNTSSMMILSTEDLRPFHFSRKQALKSPQCISFNDTVDTSAFYKEQLLPCRLLSSPCQLFLPPFPDQLIVTGFLQQLKPCVQGPRRSIPELSEAWMSCRAWFGHFSYAVLLKQNILTLTRPACGLIHYVTLQKPMSSCVDKGGSRHLLAIVTLVDDIAGFFFMLEKCYLSAWVNQRPAQLQCVCTQEYS